MVERQLLERDGFARVGADEFNQMYSLLNRGNVGLLARIRDDYGTPQRREMLRYVRNAWQGVDDLAVVVIALDREEDHRLDLAKAVEDALPAEIGRAGRPDRAEAGRSQHEDDRLRHVRHEGRDAIAFFDAGR